MRTILYLYKCGTRLNHNIPKIRWNFKVFGFAATTEVTAHQTTCPAPTDSLHSEYSTYAKCEIFSGATRDRETHKIRRDPLNTI